MFSSVASMALVTHQCHPCFSLDKSSTLLNFLRTSLLLQLDSPLRLPDFLFFDFFDIGKSRALDPQIEINKISSSTDTYSSLSKHY